MTNFRLIVFALMRRSVGRAAGVMWPVLLVLLIFCVVDATRIEPKWLQVTHHTLTTSKLPAGSRLRIVQLADIHLDMVGVREIQMLNLTERECPDLIVLTGDHSVRKGPETQRQLEDVARRLAKIAPVYAIEGNWDLATDMAALERGGAHLLRGWTDIRARGGARVALGCVDWRLGRLPNLSPGLDSLYKIVLCHVPQVFMAVDRRHVDLMLAGHTHGGQIRLPIFGALLPDRQLVGKYQAGMYSIGSSRLYVSRGIGMEGGPAPKVRFWCRPEVAVIDIYAALRAAPGAREARHRW